MIEKPSIIFTSLGRTGTRFFSVLFREIIPDGTSLHEPDSLHLNRVLEQIEEAGFYNMIIRKALGMWSTPSISHARVQGRLGYSEAVRRVLRQRKKFVESRSGSVYVESALAYYGLIDVLREVYARHRVVYIVRDGREWIRSKMNRATMYNRGPIEALFAHRWPVASDFDDDPYRDQWSDMSRFERLCWAWAKLNGYALATIPQNPDARLFYFEHIFESEDRYQHLTELVEYATALPGTGPISVGSLEGSLDRRVNVSSGSFPSWEGWSPEQRRTFRTICGSLMEQLGYELESHRARSVEGSR